jgi:hypothetical protein
LDTEAFVREMFRTDLSIRYIAIVDNEFHILASKQREGVASYTSEETERNYMSIMPPIIMDAIEKMRIYLGQLEGITAHFEKVLLVFYRIGNLIVVISFNPEVGTPFYERVTNAFKKLSSQYLT